MPKLSLLLEGSRRGIENTRQSEIAHRFSGSYFICTFKMGKFVLAIPLNCEMATNYYCEQQSS